VNKIAADLAELNPEALLLEPREVYDVALVGMTNTPDDQWPRPEPSPWVAVYDYALAVEAVSEAWEGEQGLGEAEEWISFNSMGAWMGPDTPTWQAAHP